MKPTAKELLILADKISGMHFDCSEIPGYYSGIAEHLNSALSCMLNAAKSAAFIEALEVHLSTNGDK